MLVPALTAECTGFTEETMNQQKRYVSYLLRLWRENSGDLQLWRASLEKPQTGYRLGFACLADLFAFLEKETGAQTLTSQQSAEKNDGLPVVGE
jgi:hypothetical protein